LGSSEVEARYTARRELLVPTTGAAASSLLDLWAGAAGGGRSPRWERGGGVASDWKIEAEEKQEKADLMRGSMNPESSFNRRRRRLRSYCINLFRVLFLCRVVFP
jgi:hypothetical protein